MLSNWTRKACNELLVGEVGPINGRVNGEFVMTILRPVSNRNKVEWKLRKHNASLSIGLIVLEV